LDDYGVLSGYEDGRSEDDKEGSRAIPSRTTFGSEASFIKEFPGYGGTRRFFFGLIEVRNWEYRCVLTLPQIELMQSDLPHTLYNFKKKSKEGGGTIIQSDIDEAERLTILAKQKAEERRKKRQQKEGYTIDEIFNGDADNS
jgi:hypothetical protein